MNRIHITVLCLVMTCASFARAQCGNVNSPYGINAHAPSGSSLTQLFDKVQLGGLGWVRIDFNWFAIESSQDVFNWSVYDSIAAAAEARGIRVYASLGYSPQWATSGPQGTGVPSNAADWYDICFRAAQRYPSIQHWGMWNEPDSTGFFAGTEQQYIDIILKNGADAIHAANPSAKVCGPELDHIGSHNWQTWLADSISQSAGKLDIVTHHAYSSTVSGVDSRLNELRTVLNNAGWSGQVWFTETGWDTSSLSETTQSNNYNTFLNEWFTGQSGKTWITKVFFYEVQDDLSGGSKWGILRTDYTEKPSYTAYKNFITAHLPLPAAPCKAISPVPATGASNQITNQTLSWTPGLGATSHGVYFGTTSPGTFQGNQSAATFNPGQLSFSTTYFWRIDEINSAGTTTGSVWSFTTSAPVAPTKASSPSPVSLATGVSTASLLTWSAGSNVTSHSVYFGTTSPGALQGSQPAATFNPGQLAQFTTYFWRIDEVGPGGTTTGDVWRFTTGGQRGDLDADGDSDQSDFGLFQLCFSGTGVPASAGCGAAQFDGDADVDDVDFNGFLNCMKGPDLPPGC